MSGSCPVPVEFLLSASKESLQDFEQAHLGLAAMLRKRVIAIHDQIVDELALAAMARLLLDTELLRMNTNLVEEAPNLAGGKVGNGKEGTTAGPDAKFVDNLETRAANAA